MQSKLLYILPVCLLACLGSCKKSLLDLQSQSAYSYDTYFNSSSALNQATIATYSTLLHDGMWSREWYFIFDLTSYEAKKTTNMQGDLAQLAVYTFGSDETELGECWQSLYRMILRANVVIDRANAWNPTDAADQANVKQYVAEANFLKAYAYLNLTFCWGRVPLITSYDSSLANPYPHRAPVADVWAFVEQSLTAAIPNLPVAYGSADLGRATQGAAIALLGKAYLYEGKWAQAQAEFTLLTQAPFSYSLATSYADLFSPTNQVNTETIFQIMNQAWTQSSPGNEYYVFGGQETWGGTATQSDRAQEYGFNDWNNTYITTAAVKAFTYPSPVDGSSYTDPRAFYTFYGTAASGGDTMYCRECVPPPDSILYPFNTTDPQGDYKWKKYEYYDLTPSYGGPASGINGQVIRYADVLLMLAESYIQQGNTGSIPLGLINQVRARVQAVPYSTLGSQTNAMTILMRERQLELCGEQTRYFDLIRWGIAQQTQNAERGAEPGDGTQPFQAKHVLFPIPNVEKNYNPNVASDISNDWN